MLDITSYYRFSYSFLNQWKVVEVPHEGIYEVCLHPEIRCFPDADEIIPFPIELNTEYKVWAFKDGILSAASGAKTYIKINKSYFLIEADILESYRGT